MVPPRWVRRLTLAPLVPILTVLLLAALPLTAIVAAFASRWLPGRWRPLRLLWMLLVYLVVESAALIALFGAWIFSGFGRHLRDERWQARHYALMRRYLGVLVLSGTRTFNLSFRVDLEELIHVPTVPASHPPASRQPVGGDAGAAGLDGAAGAAGVTGVADSDGAGRWRPPLLVFSRHAGPGDSFLLVHALLQAGYRPRIVLKGTLQLSPGIDVLLNRLPAYFVARGAPRGTGTRAITELCSTLGPGDAIVLFPEGKNFTPSRRLHSITRLEELDRHDEAEEAREMRHVLTPRTGGALAALDAAPDAHVAFLAHTGLEELSGIVDLWRGLPMDSDIKVKGWRVPPAAIPRVREARVAWLMWWWRQIDAWILTHYGEDAIPDAAVAAVVSSDDDLPT